MSPQTDQRRFEGVEGGNERGKKTKTETETDRQTDTRTERRSGGQRYKKKLID